MNKAHNGVGGWVYYVGDRFFLSGDLLSSSNNKSGWQTAKAELRFLGATNHVMSVLGEDLGRSFDGYSDNFGWERWRLMRATVWRLSTAIARPVVRSMCIACCSLVEPDRSTTSPAMV